MSEWKSRETQTTGLSSQIQGRDWSETSSTARRTIFWKLSNAARYILPYPKKLLNYLGLRTCLSAGKADHRFYPVKLGLEVTRRCNLRCPLCPRSTVEALGAGDMEWNDYVNLIDTLSPYLFQVRLHGLGEPMLHPLLPQMVGYAHAKGIYTNFHTNGHFLNSRTIPALLESGLDEINIAMDGMSQETYGKYRIGGDLERVKEGVIGLSALKLQRKCDRPRINLQFLVMGHNEHEIPELRLFAAVSGVDMLYLKSVNITTGKEAGNTGYLPKDPSNRRYTADQEVLRLTENRSCTRVFMETIVNWDGSVSTCTGDHPGSGRIHGNLFRDRIEDVLFGPEYVRARETSLQKEYDSCRYCVDARSPV